MKKISNKRRISSKFREYREYLIIVLLMDFWEGGEVKMQVTDVRIRKITDEGKMKAIVSVTFDNEFVVHDIKIIEGQNGFFIAMPSRRMADGDFKDIAHPINSETRSKIQEAIFKEYEKNIGDE